MAHFKCLTCGARVWRDGAAADHAGDLCPACAGPLEQSSGSRSSSGSALFVCVRVAIGR